MSRIIDGRELEPPQPLELTLEAVDTLADGEELTLLLYCQPHPLYNALRSGGFSWREQLLEDGTREILIRRRGT